VGVWSIVGAEEVVETVRHAIERGVSVVALLDGGGELVFEGSAMDDWSTDTASERFFDELAVAGAAAHSSAVGVHLK
jgi:hypothetical protein